MKITDKKNLRYQERDHGSDLAYLQKIHNLIQENDSADIVDVDESGFEETTSRPSAGSKKGHRSYGDRPSKASVSTDRISGKRGQEIIAPVLDEETTTTWRV